MTDSRRAFEDFMDKEDPDWRVDNSSKRQWFWEIWNAAIKYQQEVDNG